MLRLGAHQRLPPSCFTPQKSYPLLQTVRMDGPFAIYDSATDSLVIFPSIHIFTVMNPSMTVDLLQFG